MGPAVGAAAADSESFLDALSPEQLAAFRAAAVTRTYDRGTALFHERQLSDRVVVIVAGRVKLSCTTENGKEVLLAVRGPGDLLGELSAIDGDPRSASAIALEHVEALVAPAREFTSFLERNPGVALLLLRTLARRLRDADRKRIEFAAQDSVGRVATRLVELFERFGEKTEAGIRIELPISQEELAGWTGCSRETVTKALHALRELGWIETGRRAVVIRDIAALRARAS
jgi:CRP/FNR family transcriptional regulator, cyclic AMP receptor protein